MENQKFSLLQLKERTLNEKSKSFQYVIAVHTTRNGFQTYLQYLVRFV